MTCLSPGIGAPACSGGSPLGGAVDPARAGRHVGNPIELASGNKYQREIEYRDVGSGLAVVRHYNSLLADEDVGLGPGWRHGFQASLGRLDDSTLRLIQADGRRVAFERVRGTSAPEVYRGPSPAFGSLHTTGGRTSWHPRDGRRLDFVGPLLARIDFGDTRGELSLLYANGRLAEVRSDDGRRMRFTYVPVADSVPVYGEDAIPPPAGALSAIELPDGGVVRYRYDGRRRLVGSELPDGETTVYGYEDPSGLALLTSRLASADADARRWRYDGNGLAVASSGVGGLEIRRALDGHVSGTATLSWNDGREEVVSWASAAELTDWEAAPRTRSAGLFDELLGTALAGLEPIAPSVADPTDARTYWSTAVPLGGRRVRMTFTTDRHGTVDELRVGGADANRLMLRWGMGGLATCAAEGRPSRGQAVGRLTAVALGARPCADDALLLMSFQRELQRGALGGLPVPALPETDDFARPGDEPLPALAPRRGVRHGKHERRYPPQPDIPRASEPDACVMPSNKDCTELHADLDMAYLSECAYAIICRSSWVPVSPQAVGMLDIDFHNGGFDAELYRHPGTGAYTLAFRGTDGVGDDWKSNFDQGRGREARQYELAYRLGGQLERMLPGADLSFTGHSLGGGLATFAAVRTGADATVFNAASLHPATADREGLLAEYDAAGAHVDLMTTWSDPITEVNRIGHNTGAYEGRIAPGTHTVLADPADDWVAAWPHSWWKPDDTLIHHSMAAVVESLETTLEKHCGWRR